MKTQLLEDIGENASPALAPPKLAENRQAGLAEHPPAPAVEPEQPPLAAELHSVFAEIAALEAQSQPAVEVHPPALPVEPEQPLIAAELHSVFEEIAALEAQFVPPMQQHAADSTPAEAKAEAASTASASPVEPLRSLALGPASRLLQPAGRATVPPAEPLPLRAEPLPPPQPEYPPEDLAFLPDWVQRPTAPQGPLFDFTVPAQGSAAAEPFTRPPAGLTPSGRRYLLWGGCVLSVALLATGGRWFYEGRNNAAALALIANGAREAPQEVKREAIAANAATQGPGADAQVAAPVPASRPASALPPLVLLEPDPPAASTPEPPPPLPPTPTPEEDRVEARTPPRPDTVALRKPASPAPKPSTRKPRERTVAVAAPAKEKSKRDMVRQPARASAIWTESPARPDTSMTATLKACREHGYGATQCVKRGCSLTRYGFACRGR